MKYFLMLALSLFSAPCFADGDRAEAEVAYEEAWEASEDCGDSQAAADEADEAASEAYTHAYEHMYGGHCDLLPDDAFYYGTLVKAMNFYYDKGMAGNTWYQAGETARAAAAASLIAGDDAYAEERYDDAVLYYENAATNFGIAAYNYDGAEERYSEAATGFLGIVQNAIVHECEICGIP